MVRNPDILADAGREKSKKKRGPLLIGFSLESHDLIKNAHKKLSQKNLDLIVANTPVSFSSSHISPIFIDRAGHVQKFSQMTKKKLSRLLVQRIQKILQANHD
jgi:phosphopantothenoylcysteine decarboxylase/phosphopantothenate--cysteine ligase